MNLLTQMQSFVRVVELGSLSAAARVLHLSLPAISRQLSELEKELGTPLVLRSTRRLAVTDHGRDFYQRAARILRDIDDAKASVASDGARGTLVVSCGVTLGMGLIVPQLAALHRAYPELVVELRLEDHVVDLLADGVDVAIRAGVAPPDSTGLVAQPIATFERVLVAAPSYLRKRKVAAEPACLVEHDCLVQVGRAGPSATWTLTRGDETRSVGVRGPFRTTAPMALREAALAGLGVASLTTWLVADDLTSGRLKRVLPTWLSTPASAWAIYRVEQRGSPRIKAFVQAIAPLLPKG